MAEYQDDWMDEETINHIKTSEDPIDHMYQDSTGNVTVGYGHMIKDAEAAKSIPFRYGSMDGRYATARETEEAFKKVRNLRNGKKENFSAGRYNPKNHEEFDQLFLDHETKNQVFQKDLYAARKELEERKDMDFDAAPNSAKRALLDLQFNMGGNRFSEKVYDGDTKTFKPGWPKLFDAMRRKDWKTVGDESHRKDVNEDRNRVTRGLFYKAAEEGEKR